MTLIKNILILLLIIFLFFPSCKNNQISNQSEVKKPSFSLLSEAEDLKITIVFDNVIFDNTLENAWGFSAFIEYGDQKILFDAGLDGEILLSNMQKLGIESDQIDAIIISHYHTDHYGGLQSLLNVGITPKVYVLDNFDDGFKENIRAHTELIEVTNPIKIVSGIYSTGKFYNEIPEQGLIVDSKKGLILITGCAHPGVIQMVKKTKKLIKEGIITFVMGGFHLIPSSTNSIHNIVSEIKELGVLRVMPSHCTGDEAINIFNQEFADYYYSGGAGRIIFVNDSLYVN